MPLAAAAANCEKGMLSNTTIKRMLRRFLPGQMKRLDRFRNQRRRQRREALTRTYVSKYGLTVRAGPFAGMELVPSMLDNGTLPRLVGSYERELHEPIQALPPYCSVVNIGSSHGYYAVGFARRFPDAQVHAFELDPRRLSICRELATANGVADRLQLHGACDASSLARLDCANPCLIFCDCEGGEFTILDPAAAPRLKNMDIIVELHERGDLIACRRLLDRFTRTHSVEIFQYGRRDPDDYPTLKIFARRRRPLALDEFRWRGLRWAVLKTTRVQTLQTAGMATTP